MAVAGSVKWLDGYPAAAGGKVILAGQVTGPTVYGTGLKVYAPQLRGIDHMDAGVSSSGLYNVICQLGQKANPGAFWTLRFIVISTGAEVAASGVNLSAETVNILVTGG